MILNILAIVAILIGLLIYFTRVEYATHSNGVILITGASTGIGRHAVEYLALKYPNYVVLAGVRKDLDIDEIRQRQIPNLFPLKIDITDHESIVSAVGELKQFLVANKLPLIAIVNNAGISRYFSVEFHPIEDAQALFNTNVFGAIDLIQQTLPLLRESKGRIVAISSLSAVVPIGGIGVYAASKFALEGLHDSLRREIEPFGISVSLIQPGYVKSYISQNTREGSKGLEARPEMISLYPNLFNEKAIASKMKGLQLADEPTVTSEAIEHAILAKYPQTRYTVANGNGIPAKLLSWVLWLLSDRLGDLLVRIAN